jgi:hypothetical protein
VSPKTLIEPEIVPPWIGKVAKCDESWNPRNRASHPKLTLDPLDRCSDVVDPKAGSVRWPWLAFPELEPHVFDSFPLGKIIIRLEFRRAAKQPGIKIEPCLKVRDRDLHSDAQKTWIAHYSPPLADTAPRCVRNPISCAADAETPAAISDHPHQP